MIGLQPVGVDRMALECGGAVMFREGNSRVEQGGRDTDRPMSPLHGEASDPPGASIVVQDAPEPTIAIDQGYRGARHDPRPSRRRVIDIGKDTRRYRGRFDLFVQRGPVVDRTAAPGWRVHEASAPAPAWIVTASTERCDDVVPTLGSCRQRVDRHHRSAKGSPSVGSSDQSAAPCRWSPSTLSDRRRRHEDPPGCPLPLGLRCGVRGTPPKPASCGLTLASEQSPARRSAILRWGISASERRCRVSPAP